jgi:hypothetical protein
VIVEIRLTAEDHKLKGTTARYGGTKFELRSVRSYMVLGYLPTYPMPCARELSSFWVLGFAAEGMVMGGDRRGGARCDARDRGSSAWVSDFPNSLRADE